MARTSAMIVDFSDVFHHAEKFGVGWNDANDLFFARVFEYDSCDAVVYDGQHLLTSVEDITAMANGHAKAQAILDDFLRVEGLDGQAVYIDAT